MVKFEGEAGIDAGGVRREYGSLLCKELFSAKVNLFEGKQDRKLPLYSSEVLKNVSDCRENDFLPDYPL